MYKISKTFEFSASHTLDGLPATHPCTRLHGHNYVVKVELESEDLNETGFVVDYRELSVIKEFIDSTLDHKHLNNVLPFNPSAENMSKFFFTTFKELVPQVCAVEVSETPKTNARYAPYNHH